MHHQTESDMEPISDTAHICLLIGHEFRCAIFGHLLNEYVK